MEQEQLKDVTLTCVDCNTDFTFTANEQSYFRNKCLLPPKRCPSCRKWRKIASQSREQEAGK